MLSRKIFEILYDVIAFLVLFEQILINAHYLLKAQPLIRSLSPNMTHFVCTFSIYASLFQAGSESRKFWWWDAILN